MRSEPIISRDIHGLHLLMQLYAASGFRLRVKRIMGWWQLTPVL